MMMSSVKSRWRLEGSCFTGEVNKMHRPPLSYYKSHLQQGAASAEEGRRAQGAPGSLCGLLIL